MARIGNETSLILKLAEERVKNQVIGIISKEVTMFANTGKYTPAQCIERGIRSGVHLYEETLNGIVREQEGR